MTILGFICCASNLQSNLQSNPTRKIHPPSPFPLWITTTFSHYPNTQNNPNTVVPFLYFKPWKRIYFEPRKCINLNANNNKIIDLTEMIYLPFSSSNMKQTILSALPFSVKMPIIQKYCPLYYGVLSIWMSRMFDGKKSKESLEMVFKKCNSTPSGNQGSLFPKGLGDCKRRGKGERSTQCPLGVVVFIINKLNI